MRLLLNQDQFDSTCDTSQPDLQAYLECYRAVSVKLLRSVVSSQAQTISRSLLSPDRRRVTGFNRPIAVFSPVVSGSRRSPQSVARTSSGSLVARLEVVDCKEDYSKSVAKQLNGVFVGRCHLSLFIFPHHDIFLLR
jgi:hypothetical protein